MEKKRLLSAKLSKKSVQQQYVVHSNESPDQNIKLTAATSCGLENARDHELGKQSTSWEGGYWLPLWQCEK